MTDPNRQNPIDNLFRRKTGEYNDISFNEPDWQEMEKKLEARDQLAASRRRQYWLSAAATLIIALLSYYTYQNTTELNELNQILNESITEIPENGRDGLTMPDADATLTENSTDSSLESEIPDNRVSSEASSSLAESGNSSGTNSSVAGNGADNSIVSSLNEINESETGITEPPGDQSPPSTVNQIRTEFTTVTLTGDELPTASCSGCDVVLQNDPVPIDVDSPLTGVYAANRTGAFSDNNTALASADQPITYQRARMTIGLNASPDLSSAGSLSNYTGPGYRFGVTVDYRLTKNLSISTGLIHSTVKYNANRGDYNPPAEYFYGRYSPVSTYAECVLLDIPLRLKMDVWNNNRSGLFISAGLSSYMMLHEEYQFTYENSQPGLGTSWGNRTGTFHLMSNAGFSVGYEMSLMQSVSLRAEPYVRLPLRDVGWGNVRLYSVGTLFSLNYQFM